MEETTRIDFLEKKTHELRKEIRDLETELHIAKWELSKERLKKKDLVSCTNSKKQDIVEFSIIIKKQKHPSNKNEIKINASLWDRIRNIEVEDNKLFTKKQSDCFGLDWNLMLIQEAANSLIREYFYRYYRKE